MKKLHFYGLLALALVLALGMAFTACSSGDSDSSDANDEDLVLYGRMDGKDVEAIISKSAKAAGDYELATGDHYIIRFTDDGTVVSKGTIVYRFPNITFVPDDGGTSFTGYFSGEELTINDVPYGGGTHDINGAPTLAQKQPGSGVNSWSAGFGTVTPDSIELTGTPPTLVTATGQAIEYALSTSATVAPVLGFKAGPLPIVFEDLVPNTTYFAWARAQASRTYGAGMAVLGGERDTGMGMGLNITFPGGTYTASSTAFTITFDLVEGTLYDTNGNVIHTGGDPIYGNTNTILVNGTPVQIQNLYDDTYTLTVDGFDVAPDKSTWEIYDGYTFAAKKAYDASLTILNGRATASITLFKAGTRTLLFKIEGITISKTFEVEPAVPATIALDATPLKIKEAFKNDCSVTQLTYSKAPVATVLDTYENPCHDVDVQAAVSPTFNSLVGALGSQGVTYRATSKTTVPTNAAGKAVFDDVAFLVNYDGGTSVAGISLALSFSAGILTANQTVAWP